MKIETIICDCCGEEIPKVKKKDIFGIEREYYRLGNLNYGYPFTDINCRILGLHLCERCSGNISLEMYKTRVAFCQTASGKGEADTERAG